MTALGRKMQARGHEVIFFGLPDAAPIVHSAGLDFVPFGVEEYPVGTTPAMYARLATLKGEDVVRYSFREMHPRRARITLEQLPEKLVHGAVEALVIDTAHFFAELAPMSMGIPYAHIWNVLHLDWSGATPPCLFGWDYEDTPAARARNLEAVRKMSSVFQPIQQVARSWAENHGLQIDWDTPNATISNLAVITQTPKEFDFPGVPQAPVFHYAGPFLDYYGRERVAFPWERLTGEPLIYASMGTLVNGIADVFRIILKASGAIPGRQLVLSIGSNIQMDEIGPIPANAIVVSKAPQIELLKRAELCITHAGINTTSNRSRPVCRWWRFRSASTSRALLPELSTTVWVNRYRSLQSTTKLCLERCKKFYKTPATWTQRAGSRERLPRPKGWIVRPMCSNERFN
jgi:zeaxanthin glucosyltransferase